MVDSTGRHPNGSYQCIYHLAMHSYNRLGKPCCTCLCLLGSKIRWLAPLCSYADIGWRTSLLVHRSERDASWPCLDCQLCTCKLALRHLLPRSRRAAILVRSTIRTWWNRRRSTEQDPLFGTRTWKATDHRVAVANRGTSKGSYPPEGLEYLRALRINSLRSPNWLQGQGQ